MTRLLLLFEYVSHLSISRSRPNSWAFKARAILENQIGASLSNPLPTNLQSEFTIREHELRPLILSTGPGFGADDGASLLMAFRGLQAEAIEQGRVHKDIAQELLELVADPFDEWAQRYKVCAAVPGC